MQKQYTINFKILSLEPDNYHLIIKGKIGKNPIRMILDTGASHTCFDMNFIEELAQEVEIEDNQGMNVGVGSSDFESKLSTIHELKIGRLKIDSYPIVLIDFHHINFAYRVMKLPEIQGVLGSDFFVQYNAVIDYPQKELRLTV